MREARARLKWFPHTQPVQYCTDSVLFISTSGHFFLIRHPPASGVFIIYRKLITYTRLQGSHLLHWLLLQKQLHTMGPWARARDYWFSRELTDLIAAKCTQICQPFPRYFPSHLVSTHLSCQTCTCMPWRVPNCSTTKEKLYVIHLIDSNANDSAFRKLTVVQTRMAKCKNISHCLPFWNLILDNVDYLLF